MESKKIKRLMCSVITATLLLCELPGVAPMMESVGVVQEVEAASRKLSSTKVSVMTGEKHTITLKGVSSKKKKSVKWKANSKNLVVSYSKKDTRNATFYARKAGTYKVIATYGKKTYVAVVKVSKKGMNAASRTLNKGQKYTLKLKGVKGKAKWSSSKKSVVTVKAAKNGKSAVITAKKPGSATITATVGKKKLVCVVKVKGTTAVVTPKPNPTTAPKPTDTPKPQPTESPKPTEAPKPTETPEPTPTEPAKPTPTEPDKPVVKATGIKLSDTDITLTSKGATKKLVATVEPANATDKEVVWESLDPVYVTVSSDGTVTAVKRGYATIACYLKSNREVYAYCSVLVDYDNSGEEKVLAESISLNKDYIKIKDELGYELEYTISPDNSDEREVEWVSSNPDVADMDGGILRGYSNGTAVITCYVVGHESIKASCTVEVDITPELDFPSEIKLNTSSVTLDKVGDTYSLVPTLYPINANIYNKSVSWSSSDSSVVSVENGTVKALKEGTAVITCSSSGAPSVSASCTVTVKGTAVNPSTPSKDEYTLKVSSVLKTKTSYNGGDLITAIVYTNAPFDKVFISTSNSNIQYYDSDINSDGSYIYAFYTRKQGKCDITISVGENRFSRTVDIKTTDADWGRYEEWLLNKVRTDMGSNWNADDPLNTVINVGQYILDNYDYNVDANKSFHNDGCGNCNASAFVLKDVAQRLGLKADVVTPKMYAGNASTSSHVVAKIYYDGKIYHVDAGLGGKAPRGKISIMYWNANEYNG